jgi:hypothetical protein
MIPMRLDRWDALWAVAIGAAATAAFFVFRTPEPALTGLDLLALVCSPTPERAAAIEHHVAEPLELSFPPGDDLEAEPTRTHAELIAALERLDAYFPGCSSTLEDWAIRAASPGAAWLEGTLEFSGSQPSDLHGQRRPLRALFREVGGEQRLQRVILGPIERRLPEARP